MEQMIKFRCKYCNKELESLLDKCGCMKKKPKWNDKIGHQINRERLSI